MKAAVFNEVGSPLSIEEVRDPKPRTGEVLIRVAACGVCHSDLHVIKGEIAFPLPAVLGHEVSGTVLEVAPDVTNVKPGDRVVASFIMKHSGGLSLPSRGSPSRACASSLPVPGIAIKRNAPSARAISTNRCKVRPHRPHPCALLFRCADSTGAPAKRLVSIRATP